MARPRDVVLVTALLGTGCGDDRGGSGLYELDLELVYQPGIQEVGDKGFPTRQRLSAVLELQGEKPSITLLGRGLTSTAPLERTGSRFSYTAKVDAQLADQNRTPLEAVLSRQPPGEGCTQAHQLELSHLSFALDDNQLSGSGTGAALYVHTDYGGARPFSATLRGTKDANRPSSPELWPPGTTASGRNPFDGLRLDFAEALDVRAAELRSGDFTVPLSMQPAHWPSRFAVDGVLLPFGRSYRPVFNPALRDLAGQRSGYPAYTTLAEPDLLLTDGFDMPPRGHLLGDTAVVSSAEVPGVSGSALLLGTGPGTDPNVTLGSRFTTKLPVPAGATQLRARVAFLTTTNGPDYTRTAELKLGTAGQPVVMLPTPVPPPPYETTPTQLAPYPRRSDFIDYQAPLPPGTQDAIYLDIFVRVGGCGPTLPPAALLLDDLRID